MLAAWDLDAVHWQFVGLDGSGQFRTCVGQQPFNHPSQRRTAKSWRKGPRPVFILAGLLATAWRLQISNVGFALSSPAERASVLHTIFQHSLVSSTQTGRQPLLKNTALPQTPEPT